MKKVSDNCGFATRLSRFGETNHYETEADFRLTAKTELSEQGPFTDTQPASVREVVYRIWNELYGDIEAMAVDIGDQALIDLVRSKKA